jgi:hypothetical protein
MMFGGNPGCTVERLVVLHRVWNKSVYRPLSAVLYEAAEKAAYFVIPSEARDLLFQMCRGKSRFLGQTPPSE